MSGGPSSLSPQISTRSGNPTIVNAVLRGVAHQASTDTLRNIPGLVTTLLRKAEQHGLPQIPPGVDKELMADLGIDNQYSLLSFMAEVSFICLPPFCLSMFKLLSTDVSS